MLPSAAIPKRLLKKKSKKTAQRSMKPKKKKKKSASRSGDAGTGDASTALFNALDLHEHEWDSSPPDAADTSILSSGLKPSALLELPESSPAPRARVERGLVRRSEAEVAKVKSTKKKKKRNKKTPDAADEAALLFSSNVPPRPPPVPKYEYTDGFLKHITYHEARREAEKPMREAKAQVKKLSVQVNDLCARFERFRVQTSVFNIFKAYCALFTRTVVRARFNLWAAHCSLDYVSRRGSAAAVPRVILSWANRLLSRGFRKWAGAARLAGNAERKNKTTNIVLRLLLRNKARKFLLRAFNRMRVGSAALRPAADAGDAASGRDRFYGSLLWTEVPPGDFIN